MDMAEALTTVNLAAVSSSDLRALTRCGLLDYIRCMTEEQMLFHRTLTQYMSEHDIVRLKRYVDCQRGGDACTPGGAALGSPGLTPPAPGGTQDQQHGNVSACIQTMRALVCSDAGQFLVNTARGWIQDKIKEGDPDNIILYKAIDAYLAALQAICLSGDVSFKAFQTICWLAGRLRSMQAGSTWDAIKRVLSSVLTAPLVTFLFETLLEAVVACCAFGSSAVPDDWATDIVQWIEKHTK